MIYIFLLEALLSIVAISINNYELGYIVLVIWAIQGIVLTSIRYEITILTITFNYLLPIIGAFILVLLIDALNYKDVLILLPVVDTLIELIRGRMD